MERSERKQTRVRVATEYKDRSRTKVDGYKDANVNTIVNTHARTGIWTNVNPRQPTYGDVSEMLTLEQSLQVVADAEREFLTLPAKVRALASNSPVQLLRMLANEEDVAILKAAGLPMKPPPTPPAGDGGTTPEAPAEGATP